MDGHRRPADTERGSTAPRREDNRPHGRDVHRDLCGLSCDLGNGAVGGRRARAAERLAEARVEIFALRDTMQTLRTASMSERIRNSPPVDMIMPVSGSVSSRFSHSRFHPILQIFRAHTGVDLAAPAGTPIVAPAAGTVRSVGRRFGYGLTMRSPHGRCRDAICSLQIGERAAGGQQIEAGAQIGTVGSSGLATAPHLHFEVLVGHGSRSDQVRRRHPATGPDAPRHRAGYVTGTNGAGSAQAPSERRLESARTAVRP